MPSLLRALACATALLAPSEGRPDEGGQLTAAELSRALSSQEEDRRTTEVSITGCTMRLTMAYPAACSGVAKIAREEVVIDLTSVARVRTSSYRGQHFVRLVSPTSPPDAPDDWPLRETERAVYCDGGSFEGEGRQTFSFSTAEAVPEAVRQGLADYIAAECPLRREREAALTGVSFQTDTRG